MHVNFFWALACLALGLIVLTRAVISYQRSRLRFQKIFVIALVLLFYHLVPSVIFGYLQSNVKMVQQKPLWRALRLAYSLQTTLLVALIVFLLIRLFLLLQRERWRRSWLMAFWGVQLAAFALRGLHAAAFVTWMGDSWFWYDAALYVSLFASYAGLILVALRAQARRFSHFEPVQASYFKWFGRTMVLIIGLFMVADFIGFFVPLNVVKSSVLSVLPVFLFMASGLLFWERFVAVMYPHLDAGKPLEDRFRSLIVEYGISAREAEVIRLVCRGKTNKEIEDALFISMATVKDHISSIYKKTGAANRVQLAALFYFK